MRRPDGAPADRHPGLFDTGPGDALTGLPSFTVRHFRVPIFLLPIYQAAGAKHGVDWEVLAAINEIETDYGRNLNVSPAGAVGWMQFMPATWRAYGVDANHDGKRDPYNPVDAIFSAARYLEASGARRDLRRAIFAYNHADWYVDSVMLRARLLAGAPPELIGSLTGLSQGRFPVAGRARYADDSATSRGGPARRSIDIFARSGSPVVAVADGVVRKIGRSDRLGRHLVLEDAYGNRFTYGRLGTLARRVAAALPATRLGGLAPASAAAQSFGMPAGTAAGWIGGTTARWLDLGLPAMSVGALGMEPRSIWPRLRPLALLDPVAPATETGAARGDGGPDRPLRVGARVSAGATIARIGPRHGGRSPHMRFGIRPAGRGAPRIDPKPILDGWKLLEETAVLRAGGRNILRGGESSAGQILTMPKAQLERRVLKDERIEVYGCGRRDIAAGRVDRRVLATLAYLAESGLSPTVTSLRCGHAYHTKSGNVSHHSSGNAVDISHVNGVPVLGHQEPGGITDQAVRRLKLLQGPMRPAQVISLLDLGGPTLHMADHADHIHIGFDPDLAGPAPIGRLPSARAGWWDALMGQLQRIENPVVPRRTSPLALPVRPGHGAGH